MSLIANYWVRSECIWVIYGCEEPPEEGRDTCKTHHNCRMDGLGSWVTDRHGEAS